MEKKYFVGLSIFQILAMFRRGIFYFFLAIYLREFLQVTNTEMTLLATFSMIANISGQTFVWGRISDKFKKRRLLIMGGESFAAIGYIVVFFLHRFFGENYSYRAAAYTIIIGFSIIEFFWSSSNLGWTALIADLTEEYERSKIMGRLQFVGGLGNILGVTASGYLYIGGKGFWEGNLFYISSIIMVISIIGLFFIPESYAQLNNKTKPQQYSKSSVENRLVSTNIPSDTSNQKSIVLNIRLFLWFIGVLAIVNIGANSINQVLQIHIRLPETFAATDVEVSLLRNTSSIAALIGGLVVSVLAQKIGDKKVLFGSFFLALSATLILPFAPSIVWIFVYMALFGLARVFIQTTSYSIVSKIIPLEQRGKLMAYYNATFYLSWGLGGTLIIGPISDLIINAGYPAYFAYKVSFLVAATIVAIGILVYIFLRPKSYKELPELESSKTLS